MSYITTTHLLERIHPKTLVVNDPFWVRNYPEKLLVLDFPDLTPPTLVARNLQTIRDFKHAHGDIILKPLYGNGGAGVFRLDPNDRNLASLHELFSGINREPLIAQKYRARGHEGRQADHPGERRSGGGDQPRPADGETRSNMHVGGRPEKVGLTDRDREICAAIGPTLRDKGQIFVGIDVIGDWLTEINVTSPTGHPGAGAVRRDEHRRAHLGCDRGEAARLATALLGRLQRQTIADRLGHMRLAHIL